MNPPVNQSHVNSTSADVALLNSKLNHPPPPHALLRDAADAAKSMRRIRLYSRMLVHDIKDKVYRKKTRPQDLNNQAESLYDENITLKAKLHNLD